MDGAAAGAAAAGGAPGAANNAAHEQYEVVQVIGKGSFGTVSKIKRKSDGKMLVWKELNYGAMREKEKQLIVSEVNILRELRHPFIVRYYDRIIDKAASRLYIIMEFCEGGDLGALIRRAKKDGTSIDEEFIWKVFSQMVIALKECHRHKDGTGKTKPVVHRDLKPGNIFLDAAGNVKVGDFGLAKELASDSKFATTNVGTPFYMSPEMINELKYNEKSDIWALGCLLFEMASLVPPFEAANHVTLAVKINAGKFNRIPLKYSEDLHRAIRWMLQLEAPKRPAVEDLEKLPRVKAGMDRAQALLAAVQGRAPSRPATAAAAAGGDPGAELARREAAVAAREAEMARKEAAFNARLAELARREAALSAREKELGFGGMPSSSSRPSTAGSTASNNGAAAAPPAAMAPAAPAAAGHGLHRAYTTNDLPVHLLKLQRPPTAGQAAGAAAGAGAGGIPTVTVSINLLGQGQGQARAGTPDACDPSAGSSSSTAAAMDTDPVYPSAGGAAAGAGAAGGYGEPSPASGTAQLTSAFHAMHLPAPRGLAARPMGQAQAAPAAMPNKLMGLMALTGAPQAGAGMGMAGMGMGMGIGGDAMMMGVENGQAGHGYMPRAL